ncbi:hypothetical protein Tco_0645244 [Tanacetum coccineum]
MGLCNEQHQVLSFVNLRLPTLPSTPILSQAEPSGEPMRRYLTEVLHESLYIGYDGLSTQLVSPPSPDYIPDPKDPQTPFVPQDEDEREPMARITSASASISLSPEAEVKRLLAMTTPSPSPPISLSPPSAGEHLARCTAPPAHSSPPPVPSLLLPSSGCLTQIQTLRIASTQALIDAVTAALPSPPLPPLPPSLYIPPPVDRRDDVPESELPPHKRLCLSTLGSKYKIGESFTARPTGGRGVDYGFVSTVDAKAIRRGLVRLGLVETLLKDAQDGRTRISQRVAMDLQRVDLLMGDRMTLQEIVWIVEEEAYTSREAWAHSIRLSQATHQELQTYRDHVPEIAALAEAELLALREQQRRARQPGPEARIPDHQDASGDADSHI